MRDTTPAITEPGFIPLCIQLAQSTFAEDMPSTPDPTAPNSSRPTPKKGDQKGSWISALYDWLYRQQVKEREAYLAQSTDIFDLERRMRHYDRHPYY